MEWEGKPFKTPGIVAVRVKARTDAVLTQLPHVNFSQISDFFEVGCIGL